MKRLNLIFFLVLFSLSIFSQDCDQTFTGEGTFYGYGGGGNCSFPTPTSPVYTGAMNELQYDTSMTCGACVEVTGSRGSLVIRIEDRCPECKYGDIDLSEEAFPFIDDKIKGRVPISWKFVPCPVQGAVKFYFKEGSSRWWTAVQIRNHKYPVTKLEYKVDGNWVNIPRVMYNYFVVDYPGMGPGPYSFRITDMYGDIIEENNIPLIVTTEINGQNQFPDCNGSSYIPVTEVNLSVHTLTINTNTSTQLTATVLPSDATNKGVSWTSSDPAIAAVSSSGIVTGVSAGNTTIVVITDDGNKTDTATVTVYSTTVPVTGVLVSPTTAGVDIGSTIALTATVVPANADNTSVTWSSSDTEVATVSGDGVVTGVAVGSATVTVTTDDGGFTASSDITVTDNNGSAPCDDPVSVSLPFSKDGAEEICFVTSQSIAYINSWNMDLVEVNGADFTNVWSNNMPDPFNGNYYIYYKGSYPWSHLEVAGNKSAQSQESLSKIEIHVFPNPFNEFINIKIDNPESVNSIVVLDELGRTINMLDKSQITSYFTFDPDYEQGIYIVKVNTVNEVQTFIINKN